MVRRLRRARHHAGRGVEVSKCAESGLRAGPLFRAFHFNRPCVGNLNPVGPAIIKRAKRRAGFNDSVLGRAIRPGRCSAAKLWMMVGDFDALAILKGGGCSSANVLLRHRTHATTRYLHEKWGDSMLNSHFDEKRGPFHGGWRFASFSRTIIREGAGTNMGKTEIVERIRARAEAVKALGATALYIYGSRVRGEERPNTDLDVFVASIPKNSGLWNWSSLKICFRASLA